MHRLPEPETSLHLLLNANAQLSGDGQLRELIQERRQHHGCRHGGLWFLPPSLLIELGLGTAQLEGLVIADPKAATWLQLRFGGDLRQVNVSTRWLNSQAQALPAPAPAAHLQAS